MAWTVQSGDYSPSGGLFDPNRRTLSAITVNGMSGVVAAAQIFDSAINGKRLTFTLQSNYSSVNGTIALTSYGVDGLLFYTDVPQWEELGNYTHRRNYGAINPAKSSITFE